MSRTGFNVKARSHGAICSACNSILLHAIWCNECWCNLQLTMYLNWYHISQSHRMGMEPTHHCIAHRGNRTMWTVSLMPTQSICCIANAKKKNASCELALRFHTVRLQQHYIIYSQSVVRDRSQTFIIWTWLMRSFLPFCDNGCVNDYLCIV